MQIKEKEKEEKEKRRKKKEKKTKETLGIIEKKKTSRIYTQLFR